ncbi:unnamed protein product, partial [Pylaiella littoralis]
SSSPRDHTEDTASVGQRSVRSVEDTTPLSSNQPLRSTILRLQAIVDKDLTRLDAGDINELPPQTMILMDRLFAHHDKQAQSSRHTSSGRPHSSSSGRP